MSGKVTVTERLYLNADESAVVPEGHPDAAFLFATPGKEITAEQAKKYGIGGAKESPKPANKEAEPPANKSGSGVTINKRGTK